MAKSNLNNNKECTGVCAACAENGAQEAPSSVRKSKNRKKARTVFTGTVIALCAGALVGLSVALYYSEDKSKRQDSYIRQMEAVYSRNYYDLLDSANDLDVQLAKLRAASTAEAQQSILYDVWSAANLAGNSLAAFEGGRDGVMKATKFVGQLGDYAHYLAERMQDGEPLTAEERTTLGKLREMAGVLKSALKTTGDGLGEGRPFIGDNGMLENFTGAFDAFVEPDVEYPQMIYDGPFSDALEHRECKALEGLPEISPEEGVDILAKILPDAENLVYVDSTDGDVKTFNYSFSQEGGSGFAQLSVKGGMLIAYNVDYGQAAVSGSYPEHCAAAVGFARKAGFGDLAVVWCSAANGLVYVNLAPVQNGVILYPDLVKVKVDEVSGNVTGLDAMHYAFNHVERELPSPSVTAAEAAAAITLPCVAEPALALIPVDETKEVLTYEFECESEGTYFVYIDAMTGEETNILYVIDSAQGRQLM